MANGFRFKKVCLLSGLYFTCSASLFGQSPEKQWVDSVMNKMSLDDKIRQTFVLNLDASKNSLKDFGSVAKRIKPGGILIENASAFDLILIHNELRESARLPLLLGLSTKHGNWINLDSLELLSYDQLLMATGNEYLVKKQVNALSNRMDVLGLNTSFQSLLDEQQNFRFGVNAQQSLQMSKIIHDELSENNKLCITYYPINTHQENGKSKNTKQALQTSDTLIQRLRKDFSSLQLPLAEKKNGSQQTKFRNGYQGLLASTPLSAIHAAQFDKAGELEKHYFFSGYDVLIDPKDMQAAVKLIKKSIKSNKQDLELLDQKVSRILSTKYHAGLHNQQKRYTDNHLLKLNNVEWEVLRHEIAEQSITVLKNENNLLPIQDLTYKKFASISFGLDSDNNFTRYLSKYTGFKHFDGSDLAGEKNLTEELRGFDVLITALFDDKIDQHIIDWIESLSKAKQVIVCLFGNKEPLDALNNIPALVYAYGNDALMHQKVPQLIFGALAARGQLTFNTQNFKQGTGLRFEEIQRLSYSIPEAVGMDGKTLQQIDKIVFESISIGSTPGAHILIAKDNKVVFEKSYGYLSYDEKIPVSENTIYDLASITKVAATTQAMMHLYEKGMIDLDKKASAYLPELKKSNKKDIIIKDILTHQSGLWPFLPFWQQTLKDTSLMLSYYRFHPDDNFKFSVAPRLFTSMAMKDSLWNWVVKSKMREKTPRMPYDYRYSDMGYYILHKMIERLTKQPLEDFLTQNFYTPLGCYTTGYLPLERFKPEEIAPTEDDKTFRKRLLIGTVHDQGAAMHGGIAGHAGLFSNANDLAKLGQMLLNKGYYGGKRYFKEETVNLFTTRQYESSRRAIGWDKPNIGDWNTPTSIFASPLTFGHTGFTGTGIWMDPEFNILYIFLSNRVHPDMNNNKLLQENVRTRIHDVIYQSIFNYHQYQNEITWSVLK